MRSTQHLWCDIEPNKLHINHWSVTWNKQTNKRMLNEWTHWNKSKQNKRRTHCQWDVDILDTVWLITITRHYKWENKSNENAMWSQKNALHTFMFPQVKCAWHARDRLFYFHLVLALCASDRFFPRLLLFESRTHFFLVALALLLPSIKTLYKITWTSHFRISISDVRRSAATNNKLITK